MNIRRATPSDAKAMVALVESVYRGESSKQGWTTEADLLDGQRTDVPMILEMLNDKGALFFVAEEGHQLRASVYFQNKMDHAYLGMLAVSAQHQGQNIGKKMLSFCEQFAQREWNLRQIRMTVIHLRTELIAWYERFGYVKTGQVYDFPIDARYGLPKGVDLKLVELVKHF